MDRKRKGVDAPAKPTPSPTSRRFRGPQSHKNQGVDLADYPHVKRWFDAIMARPAVQRGIELLTQAAPQKPLDDEARDNMFGTKQYERR